MSASDLILDCTTLFHIPVQTGIQRVVRRLIRNWPAGAPRLHVARFHPEHGLVRISDAATAILLESQAVSFGSGTDRLHLRLAQASPLGQAPLPPDAPVLLAEVFFEPQRIAFYRAALRAGSRRVAMLAYDFMPFLHSGLIDTPSVVPLMGYLRLMTEATAVAFISEQTRTEYVTRIVRRPGDPAGAGPVFCLGADGLPAVRQRWDPARLDFVCIGTIARRKNQHLVAEAFRTLWAEGSAARLVLVGHDMSETTPSWLLGLLAHPRFAWWNAASDDQAGDVLGTARATIFASEVEGFGLPPIESLHAGVPVIVPASVPSLGSLPPAGQCRLEGVSADSVRTAVSTLLDDAAAARLWAEAATLSLPGWADFARDVAGWAGTLAAGRERSGVPAFRRSTPSPDVASPVPGV